MRIPVRGCLGRGIPVAVRPVAGAYHPAAASRRFASDRCGKRLRSETADRAGKGRRMPGHPRPDRGIPGNPCGSGRNIVRKRDRPPHESTLPSNGVLKIHRYRIR